MRTSDILNVQVVNYISTQVRALRIYSELLADVNHASDAPFEQIQSSKPQRVPKSERHPRNRS
jgi:hypothetical protein